MKKDVKENKNKNEDEDERRRVFEMEYYKNQEWKILSFFAAKWNWNNKNENNLSSKCNVM